MITERDLTAHHEAGHVVAVLLRSRGELTSVTIEPTHEFLGHTGFSVKPWDHQFVTFAGPWAEARVQWPRDIIDGEDDGGFCFSDYVSGAFWINRDGDFERYRRLEDGITDDGTTFTNPTTGLAELERQPRAELIAEREQLWHRELEHEWSTIRMVAQMLLDGCTDVQAITAVVMRGSS